MVEQEAGVALPQQPGLKEKASLLERLRAIQADVEVNSSALTRLNEKATELYEKTGDQAFAEGPKSEFNTQFTNITAVIKVKICHFILNIVGKPLTVSLSCHALKQHKTYLTSII